VVSTIGLLCSNPLREDVLLTEAAGGLCFLCSVSSLQDEPLLDVAVLTMRALAPLRTWRQLCSVFGAADGVVGVAATICVKSPWESWGTGHTNAVSVGTTVGLRGIGGVDGLYTGLYRTTQDIAMDAILGYHRRYSFR
jgi:hypothetical protein